MTDADLYGPPRRARTPAPGSRPCQAANLAARLPAWTRPGSNGETPRGGAFASGGHLIGTVDVGNTDAAECTLQGEVPVRMLVGGVEVPMFYSHRINDEARRRVIVVPAGGRASLRVDWTGPFCQPTATGARELAIELPQGGGTVRAPVMASDTPGCSQGEGVNPNAQATLSSDGFSEPAEPAQALDSPLSGVRVAVSGPDSAVAGERITYHVVIANPTATAVPLDPCPGYLVELLAMGDARFRAVGSTHLRRLNCRPVRQIQAGASVRFEMVAQVPAELTTGRELFVTWKLRAPRFAQGANHWGQLRVRIR
jgi:hypothetical protein